LGILFNDSVSLALFTQNWIANNGDLIKTVTSIIAVILSFTALAISLYSSKKNSIVKKFELSITIHDKILKWYSETIDTLSFLRFRAHSILKYKVPDTKIEHPFYLEFFKETAKLSVLIEKGRYFFPNIERRNEAAENKLSTFHGKRQAILDVLVLYYNICEKSDLFTVDKEKGIDAMLKLQKLFTEWIMKVLNPKDYNEAIKKQTKQNPTIDKTFLEFIDDNACVLLKEKGHGDYKELFELYKYDSFKDDADSKQPKAVP
jgi:hypothetical protein